MSLPSDGFDQLVDRFADSLKRVANRPKSASEWLERTNQEVSIFSKAIDNVKECGCGGRDGVIVTVCSDIKPSVHGMLIVGSFSHHRGDSLSAAFLTCEEAKQLVNVLGEAIAVSERAAAAAGGNQ